MLIRNKIGFDSDNFAVIDEALQGAAIKDCKKTFYMFIDINKYNQQKRGIYTDEQSVGIAFQVNLSIADGRGAFSYLGKGANTSYIRMNVYIHDVCFEEGYLNPKEALFTLRSAFGTEIFRDYNMIKPEREEIASDVSIYNKLYDNSYKNVLSDLFSSVPNLVPPEYYTPEHMFSVQHDFYSIGDVGTYTIYGYNLFDQYTELRYFDIKLWPDMYASLYRIYNDIEHGMYMDSNIDEIQDEIKSTIHNMFEVTVPTMINDVVFVYDSNEGFNIIGGSVPFEQYRSKHKIIKDFKNLKNIVSEECKNIEEDIGHPIRVFYSPLIVGDKMKVIIKNGSENIKVKVNKEDSASETLKNIVSMFDM